MEQRTCNIIMCCKGHCKLAGENAPPLEAIAAYMSAECACPKEDYTGKLMDMISFPKLSKLENCSVILL